MEAESNENNCGLEEITVILSPLEEIPTKIPLFGEAYSRLLKETYKRFIEYKYKMKFKKIILK